MIMRAEKKRGASGRRPGKGFKYKPRNAEAVKARAEQSGGRFDSAFKSSLDLWRPKEGDNLVRILPPTWDSDHYGLDIWVHKFIGADNGTYLCNEKMVNKPCKVCNAMREAKAEGEADEVKALTPARQVVYWIRDRDDDANPPNPQLFAVSWQADKDIAKECHDNRTGKLLLIDHPDDGYDLRIFREGKGLRTRYKYSVARDNSPIDDDAEVQDNILAFITDNPLPSCLHYYSSEHIQRALEGVGGEKDEELDERPDRTKRRPADEEDDEDGGKKKPARGRSSEDEDERPRRTKPARDEDEDEDPEDEEEQDEEDNDAEAEEAGSDEDDDDADPEDEEAGEDADEDEASDDEDEDPEDEEEQAPRKRPAAAKPSREPEKPRKSGTTRVQPREPAKTSRVAGKTQRTGSGRKQYDRD